MLRTSVCDWGLGCAVGLMGELGLAAYAEFVRRIRALIRTNPPIRRWLEPLAPLAQHPDAFEWHGGEPRHLGKTAAQYAEWAHALERSGFSVDSRL